MERGTLDRIGETVEFLRSQKFGTYLEEAELRSLSHKVLIFSCAGTADSGDHIEACVCV